MKEEQIREEELRREKREKAERQRIEQAKITDEINDTYEYKVISVKDNADGSCDTKKIENILFVYAGDKWRLHSIYTNEIGKVSSSSGYGGISSGTNATIDQTIIVLERLVRLGKH